MSRGNRGKRYGGPWYGDEHKRLLFEHGARRHVQGSFQGGGRQYTGTLPVPGYESRRVTIKFRKGSTIPHVTVDGPTDSPHRYGDGSLCVWYPHDPVDQRWVFYDGLDALLGLIALHLFSEAWWREYGEWLGPEAPHAPPSSKTVEGNGK